MNMANYYFDSDIARLNLCVTVLVMTLNGQNMVNKVILPN